MPNSRKNIAKSLSMLTFMIVGGVTGTAAAAESQAAGVPTEATTEAAAKALDLQMFTSVMNADVNEANAATYLAARHDDDDTLIEHHHVGSASNIANTSPTAFVV